MKTMHAIVFDQPGDESVLRWGEAEVPSMGLEDLRIRVRATAVNRADLMQRRGFYPPPPGASPIIGLECAGEVIEVGAKVDGWKKGDRAMALLAGGGYAEEVVAHAGSALKVPEVMAWEEAGSFPEVFLTAFLNIFQIGMPREGGSVLIHGGGSGVGTAATTLCKEAGLKVIVTAGSDEKCAQAQRHGADVAINYRSGDFSPAVREATGGKGADVILDCVGGKYLASNQAALANDGALVIIGLIGGARAELDLVALLTRRQRVIGSTLRARSVTEKAAIVAGFLEKFGAAFEAGKVRPVVDRVLPIQEAAEAHRIVESSVHFGKVALKV